MAGQSIAKEQKKRFNSFGLCELRLVDLDHNKKRYYCIILQPGLFDVSLQRQWGRLGSKKLRERDESFDNMDLAMQRANRLYRERLRRGYKEF